MFRRNKQSIEDLLDQLPDPESKAYSILRLKKKLPLNYIKKLLKNDDDKIRPFIAAELYQKIGDTDKAIEFYLKANNAPHASNVALETGDPEQAINIYLHADNIPEDRRKDRAINIAKEHISPTRAIEMCEQYKLFLTGANIAKEAGMTEKANELYLKQSRLHEAEGEKISAARMAKEGNDLARVKQLSDELITEAKNTKKGDIAAFFAYEFGDLQQAINICLEYNLHNTAAEYYEKKCDNRNAADCYVKGERFVKAIRIYLKLGDKDKVEEVGRKLIQKYLNEDHFGPRKREAAKVAELLGLHKDAMNLYENIGRLDDAARIAKNLGNQEKYKLFNSLAKQMEPSESIYDVRDNLFKMN